MKVDDLRLLFAYNGWANGRILAAASGLSMAELRAPALPDPGYGTLLGSIVHILDAEYAWRSLLQEGTWAGELTPDDFATLEDLAATWRTEATAMRAYLATLTDADMVGIVRYEVEEGRMRERVRWHCLLHVVNHGTYHRGEAAALLTGLGRSPGELDFTVYLLE